MKSDKRDLLIHYDEDRGVVVFHSVPTAGTAKIRSESFDGVQPPVDYYQSLPPDEAEMMLGGLVFSLIDLNSHKKIGIRDYAAEAETAHALYVQELEVRAKGGDPEAQHDLFVALHSAAMKHYSLPDLLRAEALLLASVGQGYGEAQRSLEDWPLLKAAAERRIHRGKPV
jgi:hypothetical protein